MTTGAPSDALRAQIELGLAQEARERRTRMWLTAAGALIGVSLLLNLLVLVFPGAVGLSSASQLDTVRDDVQREVAAAGAAQRVEAEAILAETRAAAAAAARPAPALAAVPGICATIAQLGDWSFVNGTAPALPEGCPAP
ncbi:MAG: hypothetical protein AB7V62_13540 [Thermoleophilia bacterium]